MGDLPLGAVPGFDSNAARVLRTAREVAGELDHDWLGAEHLLIALARESDGVAGAVLRRLGLTPVSVRAAVLKIVGRGGATGAGQTLTPRAQQLIGIAYGLALRDGRATDPDDLLLGLFSAGESLATTVVTQAGADLAALKRELLEAPHSS